MKLLAIIALFLVAGTMDYNDQLDYQGYEYAVYTSIPDECFTDSCVGCTDDCLDNEVTK